MIAEPYQDRFWTSADGLKLHARDYAAASGPARLPVVCIHGLTRNAKDFEKVAPRLAAGGRRVLAVDVRGRGLSAHDPNPMNYNPMIYAADVTAMMDALGVSRAVFIGTSMGGIVTMTLAAMRSEAVAGAVLNDIGAELATAGLKRIAGYVGVDPHVADWAAAAASAKAANQAFFPHYSDADWADQARRTFTLRDGRLRPDYDLKIAEVSRQTDPDNPPDLWPLFSNLGVNAPLMLVHGELSDLLTDDAVERMRAAEFDMAYVKVRGVGHPPSLAEPEVVTAMDGFLRKVP